MAQLPQEVRQLLTRRLDTLPAAARQVLEVASVVGQAFAAAAVAAGTQGPVEAVDAVCDGLVTEHRVLEDTGVTVWPDGTRGGGYRFHHALYQQVLYEALGTTRRAQLHRQVGARLEEGYGARAGDIAAQLALHFERGGEVARAVPYLQQAADTATAPGLSGSDRRPPKGWRCWRPSPRAPRAPGTNSRSCCSWDRA